MMPELGKRLVHTEGVALVREWIAAMAPAALMDRGIPLTHRGARPRLMVADRPCRAQCKLPENRGAPCVFAA